jgi:hypothetical protein
VLRVVAWLIGLGLVVGCDPDTSQTSFLCGADLDCPAGQGCAGGRCKLGGALGPGVGCGDAGTCANDQQCCVDGTNGPRCIRGGDKCPGLAAICDGAAGCPAGAVCCGDSSGLATCRTSCADRVCRPANEKVDCPSDEPHCCATPGIKVPWGTCYFRCLNDAGV